MICQRYSCLPSQLMMEDGHTLMGIMNMLQYDEGTNWAAETPGDESMIYDGMDFSDWDKGRARMRMDG
jgi:hypothetical protein